MDLKGIKWAGNIYQKFETMCLEVEEVMYEDTVKYVENQVQKVGASVKKFYSEVMQDMVPPSCVDPVKVATGDLALNPYAHIDINKKPKLNGQKDFKKKDTEDEEISHLTSGKDSLFTNDVKHFSPQSCRVLVENTNSELCSAKSKKVGIQKRSIGIKRISQNSGPSKVSCPMASLSGDKSIQLQKSSLDFVARLNPGEAVYESTPTLDATVEFPASDKKLSAEPVRETKDDSKSISDKSLSAEYGRRKIDESDCTPPASDKILSVESLRVTDDVFEPVGETKDDSKSTSDKILSAEYVRRKNDKSKCTPPASDKILSVESLRVKDEDFECASHAPDKNLSAESARQKKDDSECTSSGRSVPSEYIGTINSISFSQSGSSVRSNAHEVDSRGKEVIIPNEGAYSSFSQLNAWDVDSAGEEFAMFYEDILDMEVIENEEIEQRVEFFEPVKKSSLEETCILVEGDELHSFQGIEKQKSYKKKIRNALSSRLRLTKKQHQFVSEIKDLEGKKSTGTAIPTPSLAMDSQEIKVRARDSFESDWELL